MFQIGDKVLLYGSHHDSNPQTEKVYKANAKYVTLMDGSKFAQEGGAEWGKGGSWLHKYIELATPENVAAVEAGRREKEQAKRVKRVRAAVVSWVDNLTPDELDSVYRQFVNMGMPPVD